MKLASDPRHKLRRKVVQELYSASYASQVPQTLTQNAKQILDDKKQIDKMIIQAAPEWPIDKINKVDLAVLRLAVWEINENKNPKKVIVDEAVELAKEFGSESSPGFVNGVLGKILNDKNTKDQK